MTKICQKCQIEKPRSAFGPDTSCKDGSRSWCRECTNRRERDRRKTPANREKRQIKDGLNYTKIKRRAWILHYQAKRRRPEGFTLTVEHLVKCIERGHCPVTGVAFDLTNEKVSGRWLNPHSPSLDRIDSQLSYTDENCRMVVAQYNIAKGELSDTEMFEFCRLIASRHP